MNRGLRRLADPKTRERTVLRGADLPSRQRGKNGGDVTWENADIEIGVRSAPRPEIQIESPPAGDPPRHLERSKPACSSRRVDGSPGFSGGWSICRHHLPTSDIRDKAQTERYELEYAKQKEDANRGDGTNGGSPANGGQQADDRAKSDDKRHGNFSWREVTRDNARPADEE
jgi:hypothetical protein